MAIRYSEALGILKQVAVDRLGREDESHLENVPLQDAVGRIAGQDHVSRTATPPFDVAASDGFVISSAVTATATKKRPVTFVVRGSIAPGDEPPESPPASSSGIPPCLEIVSGAQFPRDTNGQGLDACIKLEDVVPTILGSEKWITVVEPVPKNANKRYAGSDLQSGQRLLEQGEKIQPRHVMLLASAGFPTASVRRRLRIALWSNSNVLSGQSSQAMDANGLFLLAALRELAVDAEFKGTMGNRLDGLSEALSQQIRDSAYDAILLSGAVSKDQDGKMILMLKTLGARIRFQGVAIQPGHAVLFATLPAPHGEIPILGLPGDAVATAACFRFLVVPLVKQLSGLRHDVPKIVRLQAEGWSQNLAACCPPDMDCFRHGWVRKGERGEEVVLLSPDQSPSKVSHLAASNCWVHVPRGHSGSYRDTLVYCYSHTPGTCT